MSESKVTQKMKIVQLHKQTLKQCLDPSSTSKIARQGPKTSKMTPKLSQNQISDFKVTQKKKVVQLHMQTLKQCLDPSPTPKIARQGPKKSKMTPKLSQKLTQVYLPKGQGGPWPPLAGLKVNQNEMSELKKKQRR